MLAHGDGILSETCTMFPREYHDFASHQEATLMPGCPAVLISGMHSHTLRSQPADFPLFRKIKNFSSRYGNIFTDHSMSGLHSGAGIDGMFLPIIRACDRDSVPLTHFRLFFTGNTDTAYGYYHSHGFSPEDMLYECNELLQDLAVNYQKEGLYQSFLTPLLNLATQISADSCQWDLCRKWQQFHIEWKNRNLCYEPFYPMRSFRPAASRRDPNSMQIHLQWIGMEYAAIRYAVFLAWLLSGREELHYKTVCDTIVILTRMTGYEDEDIYEYLENSFESLYWKWGYFAMILADV